MGRSTASHFELERVETLTAATISFVAARVPLRSVSGPLPDYHLEEYRQQFEILASLLQNISEEESNFINGLKANIKTEVQLLKLVGLEQIMEVAFQVEERNNVIWFGLTSLGPFKSKYSSLGYNPYLAQPPNPTLKPLTPVNSNPYCSNIAPKFAPPFKRLTDAKIQSKQENGLCYHCDEKFIVDHRCKNKELQVMVIRELKEEHLVDSETLAAKEASDVTPQNLFL